MVLPQVCHQFPDPVLGTLVAWLPDKARHAASGALPALPLFVRASAGGQAALGRSGSPLVLQRSAKPGGQRASCRQDFACASLQFSPLLLLRRS